LIQLPGAVNHDGWILLVTKCSAQALSGTIPPPCEHGDRSASGPLDGTNNNL